MQNTETMTPDAQPIPTSPVEIPTPQKHNKINILVLSVIFLLLGSTSFFAYQYVQLKQQVNSKPTPSPIPFPETPPADLTADWKTYNNNYYFFRMDYPIRFEIAEITKREDYYDTLATLTSPFKESITLRAIHDIDIYKNNKPEMVAEREVMDSGFKYGITATKIGDYFAAITAFDNNPDKKSPTVTIAHPNKNLFIVIDINANLSRVEFDQILSTFRFLDEPTTTPVAKYSCPANGWVDCIPGPDAKPECSIEAMLWYKTNCPNFQGGAL